MKTSERVEARRLRSEEGRSVREIADLVRVSRGTVSVWVRDIELSPAQHEALRQRNPAYNGQRVGQAVRSARARELRRTWQEEGRLLARRGESMHAGGAMLFWAEGDKCRNSVRLSNSDPEVLRFFLRFLRQYYDVTDDMVSISCFLFADHLERQHEVEHFWLETLSLPQSCLRKSMVNIYSKHSQKKRKNKLPYGTCKLVVSRTRIAMGLYGAIQEYGRFERPQWLD